MGLGDRAHAGLRCDRARGRCVRVPLLPKLCSKLSVKEASRLQPQQQAALALAFPKCKESNLSRTEVKALSAVSATRSFDRGATSCRQIVDQQNCANEGLESIIQALAAKILIHWLVLTLKGVQASS